MGFHMKSSQINEFLEKLSASYQIYAPKRFVDGGAFSDTDCIRYGQISKIEEAELKEKSDWSFKEILTPISQTLFYFTEQETTVPEGPKKGAVIFLRSCDLHGLKRLDDMYLKNGPEDFYYQRLRENLKFVLIGCDHSYENCFCVSMETNKSENYDMSIHMDGDGFAVDCKDTDWQSMLESTGATVAEVTPSYVKENDIQVKIPDELSSAVVGSKMWDEYDSRCINCGRCNFVCPTCTCFTMQDFYYTDNGNVGERRRIQASCMVDGFTDVAGGGSYRQKNGQRMRFKVLHKVLDYKERNGYHMCVGCGRCDDVCPEYISFSNCVNKLEDAVKEVSQ